MNITAGYEVRYYDNYKHFERCKSGIDNPKILHSSFGNKLMSGKLRQTIESIWSFEFSIPYNHQFYSDINFIVGLIEIINLRDGEVEFIGRVLSTTGEMSSNGFFSKSFICEDLRGYLHDSSQIFTKYRNDGAKSFFNFIINQHNQQVEPHKRFIVRNISVKNETDTPFRYVAYDDTFETIKTYVLERMGGHLVLHVDETGHLYLDWLKDVGKFVDSPIQLGKNIKSAKRELNPDGIITRLVPVGADKDDSVGREEETGQYVTRERVTIESVNNGIRYLEDSELVREFGIIQKSVDWTEISDPSILKSRGQQYLDNQKLAVASWSLDTVELYLIDPRFTKYKVGNTHPIINPPLTGVENLQIIEKEIDILNPQTVSLKIGSSGQSLSVYQLQQQEAKKSMQRQGENEAAARRKAQAELEATQRELEKVQSELKEQLSKVNTETNKMALETALSQNNTLLESEKKNLETLNSEKTRLENLGTTQAETLSLVETQIAITNTRIANYTTIIEEITLKLKEIEDKEQAEEKDVKP